MSEIDVSEHSIPALDGRLIQRKLSAALLTGFSICLLLLSDLSECVRGKRLVGGLKYPLPRLLSSWRGAMHGQLDVVDDTGAVVHVAFVRLVMDDDPLDLLRKKIDLNNVIT